jgi:hypothetical protein
MRDLRIETTPDFASLNPGYGGGRDGVSRQEVGIEHLVDSIRTGFRK